MFNGKREANAGRFLIAVFFLVVATASPCLANGSASHGHASFALVSLLFDIIYVVVCVHICLRFKFRGRCMFTVTLAYTGLIFGLAYLDNKISGGAASTGELSIFITATVIFTFLVAMGLIVSIVIGAIDYVRRKRKDGVESSKSDF